MIYVSIFAYAISKTTDDPGAFVKEEIARGEQAEWPCFRTLARLRTLEPNILLTTDTGTLIGKARSRAAGKFLESGADLWVSIDDDIDATAYELTMLLGAIEAGSRVVVAPVPLRDKSAANVIINPIERPRIIARGKWRTFPVEACGFSLAAFSRSAIFVMAEHFRGLHWENPDTQDWGEGLFLEAIEGHRWHGEDIMFARRAGACGITIEALADSHVLHAGSSADLSAFLQKCLPAEGAGAGS